MALIDSFDLRIMRRMVGFQESVMPKFASLQLFKSYAPVARLLAARMLQPQQPGQCYFDHSRVVLAAAGIANGRVKPLRRGGCGLDDDALRAELAHGPLLLSGCNVTMPGSRYTGMHTVALLAVVHFGGQERILGIDLDDTVRRLRIVGSPDAGNFGGILYDFAEICGQVTPYVDASSGLSLDMYQRPAQRGTCTIL